MMCRSFTSQLGVTATAFEIYVLGTATAFVTNTIIHYLDNL